MNNEKEKNNLQTYIILRLQSFSVLREVKPEQHISRFEAYCDLIDRMQCQGMKLHRGTVKANLKPGEFLVATGELAEQWGWARPSVRRFIDDLEEAGLVMKRPLKTSYIIYLPIQVLPENLTEMITDEVSRHNSTNVATEKAVGHESKNSTESRT